MVDRDFYGFNIPDRESWSARVIKYVNIPQMPADLRRIIAEYGSTFIATATEACHDCELADREAHGPFDIIGGLDAIRVKNITGEPMYRIACLAEVQLFNLKDKRHTAFNMLSDGTWHRQILRQSTHYHWAMSLSNPDGKIFNHPPGLPRDACIILDNWTVKDTYAECVDPRVITIHCALPMVGHLMFRPDVF